MNIVPGNDYLMGLKLAEFWLAFPRCTIANATERAACLFFLFNYLFLDYANLCVSPVWEANIALPQLTHTYKCVCVYVYVLGSGFC